MRKAMICVSVMLAILQIWPMMFGHDANQAIAAEPIRVITAPRPAAQNVAVLPIPRPPAGQAKVANPPMESCLRTFRRALDACHIDDTHCRLRASDRWEVCEATGF